MLNKEFKRYVKISSKKDLDDHNIPFTPGTLRRWHSMGINKQIFRKLGGRLFIDLYEFQKWAEESRSDNKIKLEIYERLMK